MFATLAHRYSLYDAYYTEKTGTITDIIVYIHVPTKFLPKEIFNKSVFLDFWLLDYSACMRLSVSTCRAAWKHDLDILEGL